MKEGDKMRDLPNDYYIVKLEDIEKHVMECIKGGYSVYLVMNGEYYDIDISHQEEKKERYTK